MSALRLDRNLVISAGAGSGKTHALVSLTLALYAGAGRAAPVDPTRAWVVTFTEKAAAELRQRLVERVRGLIAAPPSETHEPDLHAALEGRSPPPQRHWQAVLRSLSAAPVGTFHSLAARLLRAYAHRLDLPVDFDVMDPRASSLSLHAALDDAMLEDLETGDGRADRSVDGPVGRRSTQALVRALGDRHAVRRGLLGLSRRLAAEGVRPAAIERSQAELALQREALRCASADLAGALERLSQTTVARLSTAAQVLAWERETIGRCEPD